VSKNTLGTLKLEMEQVLSLAEVTFRGEWKVSFLCGVRWMAFLNP